MAHLDWPDLLVIGIYFLITAYIGYRVSHRKTTSEDLFLAGRSLGPAAVGFSLFASNISSDTLVGLPGAAYETGISVANYEWMAGLVLIFATFLVVPALLRGNIQTMPEMMERRFDSRMRGYLSAITLFLSIVLDTAATLYAGSLIVTTFMPQLNMVEVCYGIAIFAAIYTAAGGLKAVVYTDFMQAIVLLFGSACLAYIVFGKFDFSWAAVKEAVPPEKMSLIRPIDDPGVPWLGLITGLPIVGFYYWTMNQYVIQRVLGARDVQTAGRAALIAASLKLLPLFFMVIPGAMAISLLPDLEHADQVFPMMVAQFTPTGLTGLIVAGIIAALMSTCSSTLNSSATLITLDFVQPRKPEWSTEKLAWCGRVTTIIIALIAATWAPMIQHFSGLWAYLQQIFAFVASPLVAVFLYGLLSTQLGPKAAFRGLVTGHLVSAILFLPFLNGWIPIHFTIIGGVLFLLTLIATFVWAKLLPEDTPTADDARIAFFARHGLEKATLDVKVGAGIVIALIVTMLIVFH